MLALILNLAAALLPFNLSTWSMNADKSTSPVIEEVGNKTGNSLELIWHTLNELSLLFTQNWTNLPHGTEKFGLMNMTILLLKFVPTGLYGLYMFKLVRDMYLSSRDRVRQKQSDVEDIELQLQIMKTKLSVRNAEYNERAEQLKRSAERLRNIRLRVRDVIASDDTLRQLLTAAQNEDGEESERVGATKDEGFGTIFGFGDNNMAMSERSPEKMDCGEYPSTNQTTPENSVYSSLSDVDVHQDCRVKIVKITNVYKVAYLKHYIKLKRLRRASRQAMLKKKIESIKSLLEDWQRTLNMVINSKLSLCYDEFSINWSNDRYRQYDCNYEDGPDTPDSKECQDFEENSDGRYSSQAMYYDYDKRANMMAIVEETNSQLANETDSKSDPDDSTDCLHNMAE